MALFKVNDINKTKELASGKVKKTTGGAFGTFGCDAAKRFEVGTRGMLSGYHVPAGAGEYF